MIAGTWLQLSSTHWAMFLQVCLWEHHLVTLTGYVADCGSSSLSLTTRAHRHSGACAGLPLSVYLSHLLVCLWAHDLAADVGCIPVGTAVTFYGFRCL